MRQLIESLSPEANRIHWKWIGGVFPAFSSGGHGRRHSRIFTNSPIREALHDAGNRRFRHRAGQAANGRCSRQAAQPNGDRSLIGGGRHAQERERLDLPYAPSSNTAENGTRLKPAASPRPPWRRVGAPSSGGPWRACPSRTRRLGEIGRDLLVVEDQAGVAVGLHPLVRPVVAAEHHDLAVDDDGLVVAGRLEAEYILRKAQRDEDIEALLFHHVAANDADIKLLVDLVLERADQQAKFGKSSLVPRKLMYWFWNQTLFFADLISSSACSA